MVSLDDEIVGIRAGRGETFRERFGGARGDGIEPTGLSAPQLRIQASTP